MNCPICDVPLTIKYSHSTEWGVEEELRLCENPQCSKYAETYAYGNTLVEVGDFQTGYSHQTPKDDLSRLHKKIIAIAQLYRNERE